MKKYKFEYGIWICLIGTQISSLLMEVLKINYSITNITFAIGVILLVHTHKMQYINISKKMLVIAAYQVIVIVMGLISGGSMLKGYYPLIYTVFCLVIIYALATRRPEELQMDEFVHIGWWISGTGSVALLGLLGGSRQLFQSTNILTYGSDRLTLSVIGSTFLVVFLVFHPKNKVEKFFNIIFSLTAVVDIVICNRKSFLLVYIAILGVYFFKRKKIIFTAKKIRKVLAAIAVLIVIFIAITNIMPEQAKLIGRYLDKIIISIQGYLGKADGLYNTGAIRRTNVFELWRIYTRNYSLSDVLFGRGYQYYSLDFACLQIFTDLGIFVGILYFYIQFILQSKLVLKESENCAHEFFQYYAVIALLENFFSGTPYGHYRFIPLIFLTFYDRIIMRRKYFINKKKEA